MPTPENTVMIVFGLIALIGGYSLFRSMLPLWGFLLGGWLGYMLLPTIIQSPEASTGLYLVGAFIIGGILGALLSRPLYYGIVFFSGAVLGGLAGVMLGSIVDLGGFSSIGQIIAFTKMAFPPLPQSAMQYLLMAIFGVLLGGAAIAFQKFMIIASSSFLGAAALVSGLMDSIALVSSSDINQAASALLIWLVISLIGMFAQFQMDK